jgi:uncharacterized cupin superfamily protein
MSSRVRLIDIESLEWLESSHGERFGHRRKSLAGPAGGRMLGCSLYELPPGRRAFPYHWHSANEEAIYVLSGRGRLRLADAEVPLAQGDYVACLVGEQGAHQVINDSEEPLRYICVSTMIEPDAVVQPDSDKVGLIAGTPPGGSKEQRSLSAWFRRSDVIEFMSED